MPHRLGGHALVDQLIAHGVDAAFCVPGESYLPVLDGLYDVQDQVRLYSTRHEGGAAFMASAYGRLTGRPGICMVTRGPGATNASIGVHVAKQDCSPMVLFVGQVGRGELGHEAFQEIDHRAMFGTVAKEAIQIEKADRIPELVSRALHVSVLGEPGPVVVSLPEDVLYDSTDVPVLTPGPAGSGTPSAADVAAFVDLVKSAVRPVLLVGGSRWSQPAADDLRVVAGGLDIPVVTTVRRQDFIDNGSDYYAGSLGLGSVPTIADRVRESDCLVLLGARPDGLSNAEPNRPVAVPRHEGQRLLHIYPDPSKFHTVHRADWTLAADPVAFIATLRSELDARGGGSDGGTSSAWAATLRREFIAAAAAPGSEGYMAVFNEVVGDEAVITAGAGNYTAWPQRGRRFTRYGTQVASYAGAMGYGVPAAIAAKVVDPNRPAIAFAGDGCMLMNGQELATAVQYGLDIVVIVVNNGAYGTIRSHQDRHFPGRRHGTALGNPDFAAFARSFGAFGETVRTPEEFGAALRRALASGGPALVEILTEAQGARPRS